VPKTTQRAERATVKTTVELPNDLWRAAKIRAMDDQVDLRSVLTRALEEYLKVGEAAAKPRRSEPR
jgi:hypothetical protein